MLKRHTKTSKFKDILGDSEAVRERAIELVAQEKQRLSNLIERESQALEDRLSKGFEDNPVMGMTTAQKIQSWKDQLAHADVATLEEVKAKAKKDEVDFLEKHGDIQAVITLLYLQ